MVQEQDNFGEEGDGNVILPNHILEALGPDLGLQETEEVINTKSTAFTEKIQALTHIWQQVRSCLSRLTNEHIVQLIYWLKSHSLNIIFNGEWKNEQQRLYQDELVEQVSFFEEYLANTNSLHSQQCKQLIELIKDPWGNAYLMKVLGDSDTDVSSEVIDLFHNETGHIVCTRIKQLCESYCDDLALNLVTVYIKCYELSELQNITLNASIQQITYCRDAFISLLFKYKKYNIIIAKLKSMLLIEGLELITRFTNRQRSELRLWKHSKQIVYFVGLEYVTEIVAKPPEEDSPKVLEDFLEIWLTESSIGSEHLENLFIGNIRKILIAAESAILLYPFCEVIFKKFGNQMKPFVIELYVRALTTDMNILECERNEEDAIKMSITTKRLSNGFLRLSDILDEHAKVSRECALTSFSLSPTWTSLNKIVNLAVRSGCESIDSWECKYHPPVHYKQPIGTSFKLCKACGKYITEVKKIALNINTPLSESLLTEEIGLSHQLCDDLVVLLSCPRYQFLNWLMPWVDLYQLCLAYLDDEEGTRNFVKDLKFVEIDYSQPMPSSSREPENVEESNPYLKDYLNFTKSAKYAESTSSNECPETSQRSTTVNSIASSSSNANVVKSLRQYRKSSKQTETTIVEKTQRNEVPKLKDLPGSSVKQPPDFLGSFYEFVTEYNKKKKVSETVTSCSSSKDKNSSSTVTSTTLLNRSNVDGRKPLQYSNEGSLFVKDNYVKKRIPNKRLSSKKAVTATISSGNSLVEKLVLPSHSKMVTSTQTSSNAFDSLFQNSYLDHIKSMGNGRLQSSNSTKGNIVKSKRHKRSTELNCDNLENRATKASESEKYNCDSENIKYGTVLNESTMLSSKIALSNMPSSGYNVKCASSPRSSVVHTSGINSILNPENMVLNLKDTSEQPLDCSLANLTSQKICIRCNKPFKLCENDYSLGTSSITLPICAYCTSRDYTEAIEIQQKHHTNQNVLNLSKHIKQPTKETINDNLLHYIQDCDLNTFIDDDSCILPENVNDSSKLKPLPKLADFCDTLNEQTLFSELSTSIPLSVNNFSNLPSNENCVVPIDVSELSGAKLQEICESINEQTHNEFSIVEDSNCTMLCEESELSASKMFTKAKSASENFKGEQVLMPEVSSTSDVDHFNDLRNADLPDQENHQLETSKCFSKLEEFCQDMSEQKLSSTSDLNIDNFGNFLDNDITNYGQSENTINSLNLQHNSFCTSKFDNTSSSLTDTVPHFEELENVVLDQGNILGIEELEKMIHNIIGGENLNDYNPKLSLSQDIESFNNLPITGTNIELSNKAQTKVHTSNNHNFHSRDSFNLDDLTCKDSSIDGHIGLKRSKTKKSRRISTNDSSTCKPKKLKSKRRFSHGDRSGTEFLPFDIQAIKKLDNQISCRELSKPNHQKRKPTISNDDLLKYLQSDEQTSFEQELTKTSFNTNASQLNLTNNLGELDILSDLGLLKQLTSQNNIVSHAEKTSNKTYGKKCKQNQNGKRPIIIDDTIILPKKLNISKPIQSTGKPNYLSMLSAVINISDDSCSTVESKISEIQLSDSSCDNLPLEDLNVTCRNEVKELEKSKTLNSISIEKHVENSLDKQVVLDSSSLNVFKNREELDKFNMKESFVLLSSLIPKKDYINEICESISEPVEKVDLDLKTAVKTKDYCNPYVEHIIQDKNSNAYIPSHFLKPNCGSKQKTELVEVKVILDKLNVDVLTLSKAKHISNSSESDQHTIKQGSDNLDEMVHIPTQHCSTNVSAQVNMQTIFQDASDSSHGTFSTQPSI